jgi:hypothetical protein
MLLMTFLSTLLVMVMFLVDMGELSMSIMYQTSVPICCSVSQLTQTGKIVEFWPDQFFVRDLKKGWSIFGGFLDPKDSLYKFCDMTRPDSELTSLVSHTDE